RTPMIQDPGNMPDLIVRNLFDDAKRKIVILAAFVTFAKAADLSKHVRSIRRKMRHKIDRIKKIAAPIGFETRIKSAAVLVDLVLVAVDHRDGRICVQCLGYIEKS